ncbi:DUF1648 domain-containing protein [Microbacterium sp.]|uniref:DUF1648 domain-containing protein n=1 Tax=Microbacterium sp. TaxID=51671 RepID=UPI0033408154
MTDTARPPLLRRAKGMLLLLGVVLPFVISAVAFGLVLSWLPELPDPVATHWSTDAPDGFGSPATYLWMTAAIGFALPAVLSLVTLAAVGGNWGGAARFMGALALGLSGFGAVTNAGSVLIQRGLEDARQTTGITGVLLASFATLLLLGAIGWAVQPRVVPATAEVLPEKAIALDDGERVVWIKTATMARTGLIVLGAAALLVLGLTVFMFLRGSGAAWISGIALVVVFLGIATTVVFRVRVSPAGFGVRSLLGWPRTRVAIDDVESVRAVEANPIGEFGGWGWRIGLDGRTGIVLRNGAAIEVGRRGKRPLVVTVDDAQQGAALLQAYMDRRDAARRDGAPSGEQEEGESHG